MDSISYYHIFKYMNEIYSFNPQIIHSYFELAIAKSSKNLTFFKYNVIRVKCFFYFTNEIINNIKEYGHFNGMNYNEIFSIVNNIFLLCFINKEKISEYKIFI